MVYGNGSWVNHLKEWDIPNVETSKEVMHRDPEEKQKMKASFGTKLSA